MGLRDKYAYAVQTAKDLRMQGSAEERNGSSDASAFSQIFNANRDQLSDPNMIKPGQVLKIPQATRQQLGVKVWLS